MVILGAGTGGALTADLLSHRLDLREWTITVIDRSLLHVYQPGLLQSRKCSKADVLTDSIEFSSLPDHIEFGDRTKKQLGLPTGRPKDRDATLQMLLKLEQQEPPLRLVQASTAAGVTIKYVGRHFPDIRDRIRDQYSAYLKAKEDARREANSKAVLTAAARLTARGVYPSRRAAQREMRDDVKLSSRRDNGLIADTLKAIRR